MLVWCMGLAYLDPTDDQIEMSVRLTLQAVNNGLVRSRTGDIPGTFWIAASSHDNSTIHHGVVHHHRVVHQLVFFEFLDEFESNHHSSGLKTDVGLGK